MDHQDCFLLLLSLHNISPRTFLSVFLSSKQPKSAVKLMALSHVIEMTLFITKYLTGDTGFDKGYECM